MILSDFKTYVKQTFKRTDKDTEITQATGDTLKDIAARHSFEVLKMQSYVNTQIGIEDYPLPSNLLHLHHPIRLLYGTTTSDDGKPLEQLTKAEYDLYESNPNRTSPPTGEPWGYTVWANGLLLTNVPDKTTYLIEINWGKDITVPSASGDTVGPFLARWDETIKWGVLSRLYEAMEFFDLADKFASWYEVGKPIIAGGSTVGFIGGITNMIEVDQQKSRSFGHVAVNQL